MRMDCETDKQRTKKEAVCSKISVISFHGYLQIINKQVGVRLGLECHLIFNSLLLLSGVHGVGDGDCAVGRTKSILAKEKSSRAG